MSIQAGIILVVALFVSGALLAARAGIRSIQHARKVSFFRLRRAHMLSGWKWLLLSLFLFSFSVASALVGEPVANQLFPPTPGPTATATLTPPPTATPPPSATYTVTPTPTLTLEFTLTPTASPTFSPTATASQTASPTRTATSTVTFTSTSTVTPSQTPTATGTTPPTATMSRTPTRTPSPTPNRNATSTAATRLAQTQRAIAVLSQTPTRTATSALTATMSRTPSPVVTATSSLSATITPSPTQTRTSTVTSEPTFTPRPTLTFTATFTATTTPLPRETMSQTPTHTQTLTLTPTSTVAFTSTPTSTHTPTRTAAPALTATISRTPTPNRSCDRIEIVGDVNVPNNSVFAPGTSFTKVWRLKNVGTCTWNTSYRVVLVDGDLIGGQNSMPLPTEVAPGQTIDLPMNFSAPRTEGTYRGNWQLRNDKGEVFNMAATANRPFSVSIVVKAPPSTGTVYDFVSNGCSALWSSGAGTLTCPSTTRDSRGFVLRQSLSRLEPGTTIVKPSLLTVPQNTLHGYIRGIYPPFKVQNGDRFQAIVNCEAGATACRVLFRLDYQIADGPVEEFWEVNERFDGNTTTVDIDLSSLAGREVKFIVSVLSLGPASGDRALWVEPRIARGGRVPAATLTPTP